VVPTSRVSAGLTTEPDAMQFGALVARRLDNRVGNGSRAPVIVGLSAGGDMLDLSFGWKAGERASFG